LYLPKIPWNNSTSLFGASLGAFAKLRKATISFVMSVCPSVCPSVHPSEWNNPAPTECILLNLTFFEDLLRKFKFHYNLTRIMGNLHENLFTFMVKSRPILLRMRNVSDKVAEKIKTQILCSKLFSENRSIY
jgi:hypothetical protein